MGSAEINRRHYASSGAVQHYAAAQAELWPAEEACFAALPSGDRRSILDIGIGGGRTTGALLPRFERYVGVDYAAPLVEAARQRFPEADLRVMDARELPFEDEFDCVLFSYNGLDYVDVADRARILRRVAAALRPGGAFIYSTHNLRYRRVQPWMRRLLVDELYRPLSNLRDLPARLRNFARQKAMDGEGWALVNDPGQGFQLLTLYVDPEREGQRLAEAGLALHDRFGSGAAPVSDWQAEPWAHFVAIKPPK